MRFGLGLVASGVVVAALGGAIAACGSSSGETPPTPSPAEAGTNDTGTDPIDATTDGAPSTDATMPAVDSLPANRDRLLTTYFTFLKANPGSPQTNGLSGSTVTGVCDLWRKLAPSPQGAFLTLTARMQASKLAANGSSMLSHVTKLYRIAGGESATATDPGSCGGGEFNRLILSMDMRLHDSLVLANTNQGAADGGKSDIADVPIGTGSFWRDSHDLGGTHAPFDISDETENGGPRGQVQYFKDPSSTLAKTALGRTDLTTLVDPWALEIDQDYDCPHNSNPLCSYTTYGSLCVPGAPMTGTELYTAKYGNFDPTWQPVDCAGK